VENEASPNDRIATLGERLIEVLEQEEDPAVVLSALAFAAAAGCGTMTGDDDTQLESVAEGFVCAFRGIIMRTLTAHRVIH
jgi:hypothetical protein